MPLILQELRFPLAYLDQAALARAPGFSAAVRAICRIEGSDLIIATDDWHRLTREYRAGSVTHQTPPEPTIAELASNFTGALVRWSSAGFPTVDSATYAARAAACDACLHWHPTARLGLGKCDAPGCGCTSLKRWLTTEKCPQSKWP